MQFIALRNFHFADHKTGKLRSISKGDTIELQANDIDVINDLVMNFQITPSDNSLIPVSALYKVLHQFNIQFEGETIRGTRGMQLILKRDAATFLMAKGFCQPEDSLRWFPGKPEHRVEGQTKKMYDDLDADAENKTGFIMSWKEGEHE